MSRITYEKITWAEYKDECLPLWQAHYDEIGCDKDKMPMKPDEPTYSGLDAMGKLQIVVARVSGKMVGYMVCIITQHMHYDVLCGFEDAYYLLPDNRKGFAGINLIKESIKLMKQRGVRKVFIHTKLSHDMGRILKFLKLEHSDEIYSGWIE